MLKDKNIALDSKMVAGPGNTTVKTEAQLQVGTDTLFVDANGKVLVNGRTLGANEAVTLKNGSKLTQSNNGGTVTVNTPEYNVTFTTKQSFQGFTFMDIDVHSKAQGVLADGVAPTGILGETFDADSLKQTSTKLGVDSYRVPTFTIPTGSTPAPAPAQSNDMHSWFQSIWGKTLKQFQKQ
jgi:hypothetical protein